MSIIFETPPDDALENDRRERINQYGVNVAQVERDLKAAPGQWAKLYGTKDNEGKELVPPTTRNTAKRWSDKPGFEVRKRRVFPEFQENIQQKAGEERYEVWVRYTGEVTERQRKIAAREKTRQITKDIGEGVPIDADGEVLHPSLGGPSIPPELMPEVEAPQNPYLQSPEAESTRGSFAVPPPVPRTFPPSSTGTLDAGSLTPTSFA